MAGANVAHKINSKRRTQDVLMSENVDFAGLLLSEPVQRGLLAAGFEKPSPIQLKAIPLGRCGLDLIVQAKSGTGKTCVFSVIALENIQITSSALQVLVLAPTREIAVQIQDVIKNIGACLPRLACHTFIGGLPIKEDIQKLRRCQVAIGSPGRVKHLIEHGLMSTDSIRIFILDEADKLLEDSFQEQINWIYSALPDNKQILALSATYPEYLAQHLTAYMRNPTFIRLNISDPALLGIKQYYSKVRHHPLPNKQLEIKTESVIDLLSNIVFKQCLIFSNLQTRAQNLCSDLQSKGWPSTCIAGSLDQRERLQAMDQLKTYKCRVLVSTDLTSRGIDADKVDLVINLDVPFDHETYLHRIGRAGRFGSFGAAVSIVSEGKEEQELWAVERKCHTKIHPLPDPIPNDLVKIELDIDTEDLICMEQIVTRNSSTTENYEMKFEKVPKTNSCDIKSEQSDDKNSNQNNSKILPDKPAQITEVNSEKLTELESNGHTDSKVSNDNNTSSKDCSITELNENNLKASEQKILKSKDNLNESSDMIFSNSSEKLVEKASDISQMYPSQQKYVFHDEESENLRENALTENVKSEKKVYSKSLEFAQNTGSHFKPNSDNFEIKMNSSMNLNQSNSSDGNLTKADSLDSPVVDVQDFLSTCVSFSKSKKSENDRALKDETDSTNLASNEGFASVSHQCNMSPNSFHERHSKLKAKLEKESVISDSTTGLLKCCSDLVKSMQSLNIGQGPSCQHGQLTTVEVKPKILEKSLQKTDLMKISTQLLDSDAKSGNADTKLCSEFDSNSENMRSESRKDNCDSKTSIRPKGRIYKDILQSFNKFQSASNSDTKPCDFVSEIKHDLLNTAKTSMVDENLKAELKNLDEIYSNIVKSRNTKTVPVPIAKSLISTGTQTYMPRHSSKLTNRMAVSSLAEFSTNRNLDNVVWDPIDLQPKEDHSTHTRVKESKESMSLMCNEKSSDKVALDNKMQDSDESYCKRNQSKSRKSKPMKGRQIQYDLKEMEQKIQSGELKFGTSLDLYIDDQPQSRILVANQNGVASLSDVEQLPARSSSSDRSTSESEICESTSDSSPASTTRRKNKMEAKHKLNESSKFNSKMPGRVDSNEHYSMNNQNFHPEISKNRNKKSQKSGHRRHHSDQKSQNSHAPDENWYEYDETVPTHGDSTQWYKQYYQTKRQSYSDQDLEARNTYPDYYSYQQYYDQLNNREHQEDRNSRNAYSDWYQQWYQWYRNYYGYSNQNPYYHRMPNGYYPYYYPYHNEQYNGMPFHSVQSKTTEEVMKDSIQFAKIQKEYIKQMSK